MAITLYVVRHAKAEDRAIFSNDHDRELTPEGIIATANVGHYLLEKDVQPDVIISSTAHRARDTARGLAEQLKFDPEQIRFDPALFDGGPQAYLKAVTTLPDTTQSAIIVGHNPDVSYFAEFLTHQSIGSMSKGAVVAITFADVNWSELSARTGSVAFQIGPKQLPRPQ